MIQAVKIPNRNNVYSYNSDKHEVIDAIYKILQKTPHRASKKEIWLCIDEYEDLLRKFIIKGNMDYRWYIPYVGFIYPRKPNKEKKMKYRTELLNKNFNEIYFAL